MDYFPKIHRGAGIMSQRPHCKVCKVGRVECVECVSQSPPPHTSFLLYNACFRLSDLRVRLITFTMTRRKDRDVRESGFASTPPQLEEKPRTRNDPRTTRSAESLETPVFLITDLPGFRTTSSARGERDEFSRTFSESFAFYLPSLS